MPSTTHAQATPASSQSETIKRLAGLSNAVAALLAVADALPPTDRLGALDTCAKIADDVASDLFALIRGAA